MAITGGGGGFSGGENFSTPNFGALCTIAGTTVLGIHSGYTKKSFGIHTGYTKSFWDTQDTQEKCFWTRTHIKTGTRIKTGPDMQHTGTSTSLQKKNVTADPGARNGEDCAKLFRGGGGISAPM